MGRERRAATSTWIDPAPQGPGDGTRDLAFDETNITSARPLGGLLGRELYALPFAEQLEHRLADGAAVKEVLDAALIANEAEAFVDEQTSDCPGRQSRVLRCFVRSWASVGKTSV